MSHEEYMTMVEAAQWVGPRRSGRPTNYQTILGWCIHGLKGVILRSEMRGGYRFTSEVWLEQFFAALTAKYARPKRVVSEAEKRKRLAAADKKLAALGAK